MQIEPALSSRLVVDQPQVGEPKSRARTFSARQDQVDATAHSQRFICAQWNVRRRIQRPLRCHVCPVARQPGQFCGQTIGNVKRVTPTRHPPVG